MRRRSACRCGKPTRTGDAGPVGRRAPRRPDRRARAGQGQRQGHRQPRVAAGQPRVHQLRREVDQQEALQEIKNGSLSISLGGHFMTGACAVIILYDYLHGIDIKEKNYEMNLKIFSTINENEAEEYSKYLDRSYWKNINFKKLSKFLNPQVNEYNFDAKKILKLN